MELLPPLLPFADFVARKKNNTVYIINCYDWVSCFAQANIYLQSDIHIKLDASSHN